MSTTALKEFLNAADIQTLKTLLSTNGKKVIRPHCLNLNLLQTRIIPEYQKSQGLNTDLFEVLLTLLNDAFLVNGVSQTLNEEGILDKIINQLSEELLSEETSPSLMKEALKFLTLARIGYP